MSSNHSSQEINVVTNHYLIHGALLTLPVVLGECSSELHCQSRVTHPASCFGVFFNL